MCTWDYGPHMQGLKAISPSRQDPHRHRHIPRMPWYSITDPAPFQDAAEHSLEL